MDKAGNLLSLISTIETGSTRYIGRLDRVNKIVVNYVDGSVLEITGDNIPEDVFETINKSEIERTDVIGDDRDE